MEELHIYTLTGSDIELKFEEWKMKNTKAHIKKLHYSTCYDTVDNPSVVGCIIHCILIEYTVEQ